MTTQTTITIDIDVKKKAQEHCKNHNIRGGLSGFIEGLLKEAIGQNAKVSAENQLSQNHDIR